MQAYGIYYKYVMSFIFIGTSGIANPPWKAVKSPTGSSFDIFDNNDRLIARIPWHSVAMHDPETLVNIALIIAAPELLVALRELAFHLHMKDIPLSERFYELINRATPGMPRIEPPKSTKGTYTGG